MDTVSRPVQTADEFHAVSPTMIRAVRPLSQISGSSSGLSLNFSGTSEENLNYTHDHGMHQPGKSQSLLELTQTEPLTMDPPENLDTLPNHVAGDVYNVMNPIPMFTDLQGSNSQFRRLHSSAREEIRADYISVPYDTTEFIGFIEPTASKSGTASVNLPESSIINLYHSVPNIRASNEIEKLYSSEDVPITKETLETTDRYTVTPLQTVSRIYRVKISQRSGIGKTKKTNTNTIPLTLSTTRSMSETIYRVQLNPP